MRAALVALALVAGSAFASAGYVFSFCVLLESDCARGEAASCERLPRMLHASGAFAGVSVVATLGLVGALIRVLVRRRARDER